MTEQELKEYAWEIGERLSHLQEAIDFNEINNIVNDSMGEMMDTLILSPREIISVFATLLGDYKINVIPSKLKNFDRFHLYCMSTLLDLHKEYDKKKTWVNLGRRPT